MKCKNIHFGTVEQETVSMQPLPSKLVISSSASVQRFTVVLKDFK